MFNNRCFILLIFIFTSKAMAITMTGTPLNPINPSTTITPPINNSVVENKVIDRNTPLILPTISESFFAYFAGYEGRAINLKPYFSESKSMASFLVLNEHDELWSINKWGRLTQSIPSLFVESSIPISIEAVGSLDSKCFDICNIISKAKLVGHLYGINGPSKNKMVVDFNTSRYQDKLTYLDIDFYEYYFQMWLDGYPSEEFWYETLYDFDPEFFYELQEISDEKGDSLAGISENWYKSPQIKVIDKKLTQLDASGDTNNDYPTIFELSIKSYKGIKMYLYIIASKSNNLI